MGDWLEMHHVLAGRAEWRVRWRSHVLVTVLVTMTVGVTVAALSSAVRSEEALDRLRAAARAGGRGTCGSRTRERPGRCGTAPAGSRCVSSIHTTASPARVAARRRSRCLLGSHGAGESCHRDPDRHHDRCRDQDVRTPPHPPLRPRQAREHLQPSPTRRSPVIPPQPSLPVHADSRART